MSMMISNLLFFCVLITPLAQDPQDEERISLKKAQMVETVDRDYERALELYRALSEMEVANGDFFALADLGAARCLTKLGRYEEAKKLLVNSDSWNCSDELKKEALDMLVSTQRLDAKGRERTSSADTLVWQLIDAAAGTDEKRAYTARKEILKIGELAVPVLKEMARRPDYFHSVEAFRMLAKIGGMDVESFLVECACDPDVSIRKRCLDGQVESFSPAYIPAMIRLAQDDELSLKKAALYELSTMRGDFCLRTMTQAQMKQLGAVCFQVLMEGNGELLTPASDCLASLLGRVSEPSNLVPELKDFVESRLEEYWPPDELPTKRKHELSRFLSLGYALAVHANQKDLFARMARFCVSGNDIAIKSLSLLDGADQVMEIEQLLDRNDRKEILRFEDGYSLDALRKLPRELQGRYIEKMWSLLGNKPKEITWIDESAYPSSNTNALISGLLQNETIEVWKPALQELVNLRPPSLEKDGARVLEQWAMHEDEDKRKYYRAIAEKWVENERIDPGVQGGLKLAEFAFKGDSEESADTIRIIRSCLKKGDPAVVKQWLINRSGSGLLEAVVKDQKFVSKLILNDHQFVYEAWSRLSPAGKESLFNGIYNTYRLTIPTIKMNWLVPMLSKWQFDPAWNDYSIERLAEVLRSMKDPAIARLMSDVIRVVIDRSEIQKQHVLLNCAAMIQALSMESKELMGLIPLWYSNVRNDFHGNQSIGISLYMFFEECLHHSPNNLSTALGWLAEGYEPATKRKLIKLIFDPKESLHEDVSLFGDVEMSGRLLAAWPCLDADTKSYLLSRLARNTPAAAACVDFARQLVRDHSLQNDWRVHAFVILGFSRKIDAVEPMLNYLAEISPRGASSDSHEMERYNERIGFICTMLERYLTERIGVRMRNRQSFDQYFRSNSQIGFHSRLSQGILLLPEDAHGFWSAAIISVRIESEPELEQVLSVINRPPKNDEDRSELFRAVGNYVLQSRENQTGDEVVLTQDGFKAMLEMALSGDMSSNNFTNMEDTALYLVSRYGIEELMSHVGHLAVHSHSSMIRQKAVNCLGQFQNVDVVPVLLECLKDPYGNVHELAKEILTRLRDYEEQRLAWESLLGSGEGDRPASTAEALIEMLRHDDPEVRVAAIRSLGKLGETSTLPILVQLVAEGTDEEKAAAKAAIDAITAE